MPTIANPVITDNTNPLICHVTLSEMPITYYNCILEIYRRYEYCMTRNVIVKRYVDNTLGKLNVKTFFCTHACMRTLRVQLYIITVLVYVKRNGVTKWDG